MHINGPNCSLFGQAITIGWRTKPANLNEIVPRKVPETNETDELHPHRCQVVHSEDKEDTKLLVAVTTDDYLIFDALFRVHIELKSSSLLISATYFYSDLTCGPPPTKPTRPTTTTTRRTTTRPTTTTRRTTRMTTVPPPPPRDIFSGQPQSPPQPRLTQGSAIDGRRRPKPGDKVMEIRMTVGQEPTAEQPRPHQPRVPPPTVVSSEPISRPVRPEPPVARPRGPPLLVGPSRPANPPLAPTPPTGQIISRPREIPTTRRTPLNNVVLGDRPRSLPPNSPPDPEVVHKSNIGKTLTPRPSPPLPRRHDSIQPRHGLDDGSSRRLKEQLVSRKRPEHEEVLVRDAYKEDNSITIKWDSEVSNILGFRVVYRLFGQHEFKQGPPLAPSEREFKIKNVPANVSVKVSVKNLHADFPFT